LSDTGVLRVAVDVAAPIGVLVRRTTLVDVLVVFGCVRIMGVETEGEAGEASEPDEVGERKAEGVTSTGASVGKGIPDSSVRGVVIAGSVPR
jgi:hypothetical protein